MEIIWHGHSNSNTSITKLNRDIIWYGYNNSNTSITKLNRDIIWYGHSNTSNKAQQGHYLVWT